MNVVEGTAPAASKRSLVLASASPRRLALLQQAGIIPAVVAPADVAEAPLRGELPQHLALRLAADKAAAAARRFPSSFVLAADTVVARGRRILPKPPDAEAARRCLEQLSGASHRVYGGIAVAAPDGRRLSRLVVTRLSFKRLTEDEIADYLAGGEWRDKAGGYAIQGRAGAFVRQLSGSYFNVVGLPLYETVSLLRGTGYLGGSGDHRDGG